MQIVWKLYSFNDLNTSLLYEILKIRQEIFIVEQFCPYNDIDNKDEKAKHLCGFIDDNLVAYSRIFETGIYYDNYAAIGRIVINKNFRGKQIGAKLMKESIAQLPNVEIKIEAQCYLEQFYTKYGFVKKGKSFAWDGILHYAMIRKN